MIKQDILCGPFIRKLESQELLIWLTTTNDVELELTFSDSSFEFKQSQQSVRIGQQCVVHLVRIVSAVAFPTDKPISYNLFDKTNGRQFELSQLSLEGDAPNFIRREKLKSVIQGSCRKPDHNSDDAFTAIAKLLRADPDNRPDYLIMAGDQIYADDISSPMLIAIQLLSTKLGLYSANYAFDGLSSEQLAWQNSLDKRKSLLPKKTDISAWHKFWHGTDIISSRYHDNHLIPLDEFFACYLLTWSSTCWELIYDELASIISTQFAHDARIRHEFELLDRFKRQLVDFEVSLANLPTLMIFDDHDVTDDWNLSADWEKHIYGNDITKHMIRDALVSYSLFQGWGNDVDSIEPLITSMRALSESDADFGSDQLTRDIFDFNRWHYTVQTLPKIVVLDTRTHRWRSESSLKNPSGLMDWERLEQLEDELFSAKESVLLVSAAPIFGVKAIEVVQKMCEILGKELLVDVENWMAHRGAARKLMSMLRHDNAPDEVIIMSGDVHYSFCFSAQRRFNSNSDKIWQLTCSGFKNEFPQKLLKFFDYVDRVAYSEHSLLNIFTKRRKLAIDHHPLFEPDKPNKKGKQRHLHSESAAGLVTLDENGYLTDFSLLTTRDVTLRFDLS